MDIIQNLLKEVDKDLTKCNRVDYLKLVAVAFIAHSFWFFQKPELLAGIDPDFE